MKKYVTSLEGYKKNKDYLICIDSDGCTFGNMDIKWKECFIPALIKCFELQPIAGYVREEAEKINLYSKTRGINRFQGLPILFDALEERAEIKDYHFNLPETKVLKKWIEDAKELSQTSLQQVFDKTGDEVVERALVWSAEVNRVIKEMIYGIPPFPFVRETLEEARKYADIAVVSSANQGALESEWKEHGLTEYVNILGGQEIGTKKEYIKALKKLGYKSNHILMLGDALGDLEAAKVNDVLFYPIIPGEEKISWQNLLEKTLQIFIEEDYQGSNEEEWILKFRQKLQ